MSPPSSHFLEKAVWAGLCNIIEFKQRRLEGKLQRRINFRPPDTERFWLSNDGSWSILFPNDCKGEHFQNVEKPKCAKNSALRLTFTFQKSNKNSLLLCGERQPWPKTSVFCPKTGQISKSCFYTVCSSTRTKIEEKFSHQNWTNRTIFKFLMTHFALWSQKWFSPLGSKNRSNQLKTQEDQPGADPGIVAGWGDSTLKGFHIKKQIEAELGPSFSLKLLKEPISRSQGFSFVHLCVCLLSVLIHIKIQHKSLCEYTVQTKCWWKALWNMHKIWRHDCVWWRHVKGGPWGPLWEPP